MVVFLSSLDEETLSLALTAMQLTIDASGVEGIVASSGSIMEFGIRNRGEAYAE